MKDEDIHLEKSILEEMDRLRHDSRSEFTEKAVLAPLSEVRRRTRDAAELGKLNEFAADYNREAAEVLDFQGQILLSPSASPSI